MRRGLSPEFKHADFLLRPLPSYTPLPPPPTPLPLSPSTVTLALPRHPLHGHPHTLVLCNDLLSEGHCLNIK